MSWFGRIRSFLFPDYEPKATYEELLEEIDRLESGLAKVNREKNYLNFKYTDLRLKHADLALKHGELLNKK